MKPTRNDAHARWELRSVVAAGLLMVPGCVWSIEGEQEGRAVPYRQRAYSETVEASLGLPFGTMATVVGEATPALDKVPVLRLKVRRIDGRATQERIFLELRPFRREELSPALWEGGWVEVYGFESGGFEGTPTALWEELGAGHQVRLGHVFRPFFVVHRWRKAAVVEDSPADFLGRRARFEGTGVCLGGRWAVRGARWTLFLEGVGERSERLAGKLLQTEGLIQRLPEGGEHAFLARKASWKLLKLEDQVGTRVELEGIAFVLNGEWWFRYRGTDLYVEAMAQLDGWSPTLHRARVVVSGLLTRERLPRIDQIGLLPYAERELTQCYLVKKAKWRRAGEASAH